MEKIFSVVMTWNYQDVTEGTTTYTVSAPDSYTACRNAQNLAARDAHNSSCHTDCRCPPENTWDDVYVGLEVVEGANIKAAAKLLEACKFLCEIWDAGDDAKEIDWEDLSIAVDQAREAVQDGERIDQ